MTNHFFENQNTILVYTYNYMFKKAMKLTVFTKLYKNALGKITDERFERLSATYEKEQREFAER